MGVSSVYGYAMIHLLPFLPLPTLRTGWWGVRRKALPRVARAERRLPGRLRAGHTVGGRSWHGSKEDVWL